MGWRNSVAAMSRKISIDLFEQATYSGGRFLFWVSAPLLAADNWDKVAILSILNLLVMMLYGSVVGGPSFFQIVRGSSSNALAGYFPCLAVICLLAVVGPLAYLAMDSEGARNDPKFFFLSFSSPISS